MKCLRGFAPMLPVFLFSLMFFTFSVQAAESREVKTDGEVYQQDLSKAKAESSRDFCVWQKSVSEVKIDSYLKQAFAKHAVKVADWSLAIEGSLAKLKIKTVSSLEYDFILKLDGMCRIEVQGGETLPAEFDRQEAFAALPLKFQRPSEDKSNENLLGNLKSLGSTFAFRYNFENLLLIVFVLALYLAIASSKQKRYLEKRDYLAGALLVTWAALPLLQVPIYEDTMLIRAMFANSNPLGDSAHPALPFLLNHPAARLSYHPLILRTLPFLWLLVESLLLMKVVSRKGGRLAGLFALVLFACEIRRRHSLMLASDWDLAGMFLLTWLAVIQDKVNGVKFKDVKSILIVSILLAAGCMSSYMMIPVAGVFVVVFYMQHREDYVVGRRFLLLPGLAFMLFLLQASLVFEASIASSPRAYSSTWQLILALFHEMPLGRASIMALPVLGGLVRLLVKRDDHSNSFVFLSILAIFFAVMVLYETGGLHGAYYFDLAVPLLIYAAALFMLDIHNFILSEFRRRYLFKSLRLRYVVDFAAVLLVVMSFVNFTTAEELSYMIGVENFDNFETIQTVSGKPVVTNFRNYEQVSTHSALKYKLLPENVPAELESRMNSQGLYKFDDMQQVADFLNESFLASEYFMALNGNSEDDRLLELDLTRNCNKLFKDESNHNAMMYLKQMPGTLHFYRCKGSQE